jgi:hypothetical protein
MTIEPTLEKFQVRLTKADIEKVEALQRHLAGQGVAATRSEALRAAIRLVAAAVSPSA